MRKTNWPSRRQWAQFFKILNKKERVVFSVSLAVFFVSLFVLLTNLYFQNTQVVAAKGGTHIEGVLGQPRYINPIYANSDADRDLIQLVFSGLMKYDKNLKLSADLAQSYEISADEKTYTFHLKENLFWQDEKPLGADDIVFTIKLIQNSAYNSPLRKNWVGVEVEKLGELTVQFTLQQPYASFLENCTLKILPEHIWENVSPENFGLEIYNLKPVGSGLYKVKEIKQDRPGNIQSLTLVPNSLYHGQKPNILEIKFIFFENEQDLVKAAEKGTIKGVSLNYLEDLNKWNYYYLSFPRYFAVFFNQENSDLLSDQNIRTALEYGTDKREIIEKALKIKDPEVIERAVVNSPILPKIYNFPEPTNVTKKDLEKAKEILTDLGFEDQDNDGFREKTVQKDPAFTFTKDLQKGSQGTEVEKLQQCLAKFSDIYPEGEVTGIFGSKTEAAVTKFQEKYSEEILDPWGFSRGTGMVGKTTRDKLNEVCFNNFPENILLEITLTTVKQPQMEGVANLLKKQWEELGFRVKINVLSSSQLEQDVIKPRNYEALLFGEVLGAFPDPFPFWHSSQKEDPGLNLALYKNEDADNLLEENRKTADSEIKQEKLASFQEILLEDLPAIFLYSPPYLYALKDEIKGMEGKSITDPSKRFLNIENWYIETKRSLK